MAARAGTLPPELPPEAQAVIAALVIEFSTDLWGEAHLLEVLSRHGLSRFD